MFFSLVIDSDLLEIFDDMTNFCSRVTNGFMQFITHQVITNSILNSNDLGASNPRRCLRNFIVFAESPERATDTYFYLSLYPKNTNCGRFI